MFLCASNEPVSCIKLCTSKTITCKLLCVMNFEMEMKRAKLNVQLSDLIYWCKNTCRRKAGYYSCAIDAVFELFFYEIYPTLKIIDFYGNELFCKMKEICEKESKDFKMKLIT